MCYNCILVLQKALEHIIREDVPGNLAETGVFRGGVIIYIQAFLSAHNLLGCGRKVWAIDSFEGIPRAYASSPPAVV